MAARQEEFIAGKDLDDLYDLLDNGFLDEDVDFEKDLAALPQESRDFFSKKNFVFTSEDSLQLLQKLKYIVEDFSGDAEKFYSGFCGLLLDNLLPSKFEDETVTNILMIEAVNHILIHLSGGSDIVSLQPPSKKSEHVLADRDFKCIQSSSFQISIKVIIVSKRCQF